MTDQPKATFSVGGEVRVTHSDALPGLDGKTGCVVATGTDFCDVEFEEGTYMLYRRELENIGA